MPRPPYTVVRDTREKEGHGWWFPPSASCLGTVRRKLDTGDYTVEGLEALLTVDRKGSIGELAGNLYQKRFEAELVRMREIETPVVLLEFDYEELAIWPESSPIPRSKMPRHLAVPGSLLARYWEVRLKHPHVHFEFAGVHGQRAVSSLFKRAVERHLR